MLYLGQGFLEHFVAAQAPQCPPARTPREIRKPIFPQRITVSFLAVWRHMNLRCFWAWTEDQLLYVIVDRQVFNNDQNISNVDIAFFYRKANILRKRSNILPIFNGNKGLCHGFRSHSDLIDSNENVHCFTWLLSSCDIKISVLSQCRILVAVQYMNTQLFAFLF